MQTRLQGFTLIEMMMVVAIIGILAAIAYPSYQSYLQRSYRADAQTALLDAAQRLERCFSRNNSYQHSGSRPCPAAEALSGADGEPSMEGFYRLRSTALTASTFTLRATAERAPQTADQPCLSIDLNHRGQRTPQACW